MAKVKLPIYQRTQLVGGDYGTGDDHYDSTVLHLSFDDLNAARTKDYSPSNRLPIDAAGTAAITRDQSRFPAGPKGPTGCLVLDGDDDWIEYSVSTDFHPNVAYTIEAHIYIDPTADQPNTIIGSRNLVGGAGQGGWWFISQGNGLSFVGWNGDVGGSVVTSTTNNIVIGSPSRLPQGEWMHVAAARDVSGSPVVWRTFRNGVMQNWDTEQDPGIKENTTESTYIGRELNVTTRDFHGYVDNVRITKGVCRYTENFTPPKAPYPNYEKRGPATSIYPSVSDPFFSDVVLLLPLDGSDAATTTTDFSNQAHTITFNGNAQLDTAQKKFGSASALFDGTSDYLSMPNSTSLQAGSSSMTIECHVRFNGDPTTDQHTFVGKWNNNTIANQKEWWVGYRNNKLNAFISNNGSSGFFLLDVTWDPAGDTWYHIAFEFDRSLPTHATRVFVDGVQIGADNTTLNTYPSFFASSSEVWVGGYDDDTNDWMDGWIDNVRITKGVVRYGSNFTPPTVPYPTQ